MKKIIITIGIILLVAVGIYAFYKKEDIGSVSGNGIAIGEKVTMSGVSITPLAVTEDSRCPADVQCVWAGTVVVKVLVEKGDLKKELNFTPGNSATEFSDKLIALDKLTPDRKSTGEIPQADYRFEFSVIPSSKLQSGTLSGSVTVGPVCPAENPLGFSCVPTPEMYAAAKVFVYQNDKKTLVTTITPDATGKFSITLPVGGYYIDMIKQSIGGTTGVPKNIEIVPGETVTLKLAVDTGLR